MQPLRFANPNFNSHQNHWRPHGQFVPMWPMQYENHGNSTEHRFPNSNENHWCETCDRGFRTLEILLNHKQQHQKCNIDGCQFIAHPKVITKHIQMQHSTGLYKKIAKLDNPEEIQKWREERKKKYPTKENVEKRRAEIKEKIDRGEKMGLKRNRENKSKIDERKHGMKRKYGHGVNRRNVRRFQTNKPLNDDNNKIDNKKPQIVQKNNKVIPQMEDSKTLKPFTGILNLLDVVGDDNDNNDIEMVDSIEDDEYITMDESIAQNSSIITEPVVCGALSSLICNYESSDEESVCKTTQYQITQSKNSVLKHNICDKQNLSSQNIIRNNIDICENKNESLQNNIQNDVEKSDDDSGPEEVKTVKAIITESNTDALFKDRPSHSETSQTVERKERQDRTRINNIRNGPNKFKSKLPSTLLEKLLRNEIRHERNIVLQCIRYIVKNNYFEEVQKLE